MSAKPPLADAEVLRVLKLLEPLADDRAVDHDALPDRFKQTRYPQMLARLDGR